MEIIFKYPTRGFTVRDIAKETGISPPTVSSILKELETEDLVKIVKDKIQYKVYGKIEAESFKDMKRIYNLYALIPLKNYIIKTLDPDCVVVFGSYAFGEDLEDSDIDIFVESKKKKDIELEKFEEKLARKIHLIVGDFKSLPEELRRNIINGVVLYGVIEF